MAAKALLARPFLAGSIVTDALLARRVAAHERTVGARRSLVGPCATTTSTATAASAPLAFLIATFLSGVASRSLGGRSLGGRRRDVDGLATPTVRTRPSTPTSATTAATARVVALAGDGRLGALFARRSGAIVPAGAFVLHAFASFGALRPVTAATPAATTAPAPTAREIYAGHAL